MKGSRGLGDVYKRQIIDNTINDTRKKGAFFMKITVFYSPFFSEMASCSQESASAIPPT